jgi:hypothetical protein
MNQLLPHIDPEHEIMRRYLLGAPLETDEMEQFEARLFTDAEFHDRFIESEQQLIEAYVSGRLDADDHRRFEQHYMANSARRNRVDSMKQLAVASSRDAIAPQDSARPSVAMGGIRRRAQSLRGPTWFGLAASLVAIFFAVEWYRATRVARAARQETANSEAHARQLREKLAQSSPPVAVLRPASVVALARAERNGAAGRNGTARKSDAAGGLEVRLNFSPSRSYSSYTVAVWNAAGPAEEERTLWRRRKLSSSGTGLTRSLAIVLPFELIEPGRYLLRLWGERADGRLDEIESFSFEVLP